VLTHENNSGIRLLMIDDDEVLCELVADYLTPFGYAVDQAFDGPTGLKMALENEYQAIILDVMLPGMDGFTLLRELRQHTSVPVLMLTSRGDETDRIVGLEIGADDYLPKTFSTRELLARLRAVTRRASKDPVESHSNKPLPIIAGDLRVDEMARRVTLEEKPLNLTSIEFDLLLALVKRRGNVLSRDALMDQVTGRNYESFDRSIDVHISSLRRKLGDDAVTQKYISTVRGKGYVFTLRTPAES